VLLAALPHLAESSGRHHHHHHGQHFHLQSRGTRLCRLSKENRWWMEQCGRSTCWAHDSWLIANYISVLQGTETKSRRRRRRRGGSGRAATTAARAPGRSHRSVSAWTRCAAVATRRAGTASSPPSASTRPSTSAWTVSLTSASGAAAPSPPTDLTQPTGQLTHRGSAHLPPPATKNLTSPILYAIANVPTSF
jgi:hypothetical protein